MNKQGLIISGAVVALLALQVSPVAAKGTVIGKVGTLGAGIEYVHPINNKFAIAVGLNGLSYDESIEESDITYDADLQMQTFSIMADYHPMANGFRLSGGLMSNGNEFILDGTPASGTVDIGGETYDAEDVGSLRGTVDFKSTAPYIGIGWGHAPKAGKGWAFDADLGVLFQGSPSLSLVVTCGAVLVENDPDKCGELQSDVTAEEGDFEKEAEDFEYFPVMSLGVSYRF